MNPHVWDVFQACALHTILHSNFVSWAIPAELTFSTRMPRLLFYDALNLLEAEKKIAVS